MMGFVFCWLSLINQGEFYAYVAVTIEYDENDRNEFSFSTLCLRALAVVLYCKNCDKS